MTNGIQSAYFDISRGIRQGDSLSALLYIIQFEPLAQKLRSDVRIKGVDVELKNCNNVIYCSGCQYVDDSNTMLKDHSYIERFLEITDRFESASGSKINVDKTVALTVKNELNQRINSGIKITTGPEKVLGIAMGKSNNNFAEFWDSKINKLKVKLDIWRQRDLSYEGKALLIKSLAVSQLLYAVQMKCVDKKIIDRAERIIFDFLWSENEVLFLVTYATYPEIKQG